MVEGHLRALSAAAVATAGAGLPYVAPLPGAVEAPRQRRHTPAKAGSALDTFVWIDIFAVSQNPDPEAAAHVGRGLVVARRCCTTASSSCCCWVRWVLPGSPAGCRGREGASAAAAVAVLGRPAAPCAVIGLARGEAAGCTAQRCVGSHVHLPASRLAQRPMRPCLACPGSR